MAIAMVALLAFGGTYAYFTATADTLTGKVTTGTIRLSAGDEAVVSQPNVLPYENFTITAEYTDLSNRGNYIFFTIQQPSKEGVDLKVTSIAAEAEADYTIRKLEGVKASNEATSNIDNVYYIEVTDTIASAETYLTDGSNVYTLVITAYFEATDEWIQSTGENPNTTSKNQLMGIELDFGISAKSIQFVGKGTDTAGAAFDSVQDAYIALYTGVKAA